MRGVVHAIDEYQCPGGVRQRGELRHIVDGAERVGSCADGEQPHTLGQLARRILHVEAPVLGSHANHPQLEFTLAGQTSPGVGVGVVVEFRDHDGVALAPPLAERASEVKRQRGHVGAEDDLLGPAAEPVGQRGTGAEQCRVGLVTGGIGPVGIGVVMQQVVAHRVHDARGHLRAAGSVEIRDGVALMATPQRRKLTADLLGRGNG